jgi:hypothetical protein
MKNAHVEFEPQTNLFFLFTQSLGLILEIHVAENTFCVGFTVILHDVQT